MQALRVGGEEAGGPPDASEERLQAFREHVLARFGSA